MTEQNENLVRRAETALSSLPLREPDWDGFASRIDGAVGSAPAEDEALFAAPLPTNEEDGEAPVTAPADDSIPAPHAITTPPTSGPTLSVAPASSDELDEAWSSAPEAAAEAPPAVVAEEPARAVTEATAPAVAEEPARAVTEATAPAVAEAEDLTADATSDDSAPVASAVPAESRREPVSLADLARASVARRGKSEKASIAKESLAVATQSRAQGDQVAQRVQAAASYPQAAPASVPPPSTQRAASARPGGDLRGLWAGVAIGAVGLAAGFALYLRGPETPPVAVVEPTAEQAAPAAKAPREPAPAPKPEAPAAAEPAREAALDPTSLPALPRAAGESDKKTSATEAKGGAGDPKVTAPSPAAPGQAGTGKVAAEKIVLEEDEKARPKSAPSAPAPRPADAKLRPAELSSGAMTDRPSAGAAQAAVGAVLGAARACVAGHPQPSSAQLVFGSDGQVSSVNVAGPAAGTPAAACIESALKKARVQPFAASSFSLGVTVRPP